MEIAIIGILGVVLGVILRNAFYIINQKTNQKVNNIKKLQKYAKLRASDYVILEEHERLLDELKIVSRNHKFLSVDDLINSNQQTLSPYEKSQVLKLQKINKKINKLSNNLLLDTISILPLISSIGKKNALKIRELLLNKVHTIDKLIDNPNPTIEEKSIVFQELLDDTIEIINIYQDIIDAE